MTYMFFSLLFSEISFSERVLLTVSHCSGFLPFVCVVVVPTPATSHWNLGLHPPFSLEDTWKTTRAEVMAVPALWPWGVHLLMSLLSLGSGLDTLEGESPATSV